MKNKALGITKLRALNSPVKASTRPNMTSHFGSGMNQLRTPRWASDQNQVTAFFYIRKSHVGG